MGNALMSWVSPFGKQQAQLLMVGLDGAGKTTVLYKLKLADTITTLPTVGFNVETVQHKNLKLKVWDMGGQEKLRPLWRTFYGGTDGIIFVVDSNDQSRLSVARDELHRLVTEDKLRDTALLVLANKQDLPCAYTPADLMDTLQLETLNVRKWHIQGACAKSGDGLYTGLDWLATAMRRR